MFSRESYTSHAYAALDSFETTLCSDKDLNHTVSTPMPGMAAESLKKLLIPTGQTARFLSGPASCDLSSVPLIDHDFQGIEILPSKIMRRSLCITCDKRPYRCLTRGRIIMRSTMAEPEVELEERIVRLGWSDDGAYAWPVAWSAVWVGALAAVAAILLFGLVGIAVGAHEIGKRIANWSDFGLWTLVFSVAGAFFSFVIGGWISARIAGLQRAENATLHGAIVWLVALPLLLLLAAFGAGSFFGSWYGGLAGTPIWVSSANVPADPNAAVIARNSALGSVTALLIGLVGSIIGGWMASGEPMSLTYRRGKGRSA